MGSEDTTDYSRWSQESLIKRVTELERQLHDQTMKLQRPKPSSSPPLRPKKPRASRVFDPSKYNTRLIALKFAYLGAKYNGYEHHINNTTPLPAVEEELWKALMKARLIFPTPKEGLDETQVNWEGCEYSKCGRTDRGVSAFGQVVGIRVRSNRPKRKTPELDAAAGSEEEVDEAESAFDPIKDELPYPQILNRLLPPDIRVLAWCPNPPPDFSARFSCRERRYRYFFTQPAFPPSGTRVSTGVGADGTAGIREGYLDIDAMRAGCREFLGLHDFRNFCKVDVSKQLTNFDRRIFHADIEEVIPPQAASSSFPVPYSFRPASAASTDQQGIKVYCLTLHGSAFLWHQVRHIVAILFLIGQGLESPSLIRQLLDVQATPLRPHYVMADDTPLVLWDCIFPSAEMVEARDHDVTASNSRHPGYEDALQWIYVGEESGREPGTPFKTPSSRASKWGVGGLVEDVWKVWHESKMAEILAGGLVGVVANSGSPRPEVNGFKETGDAKERERGTLVYLGGDATKISGRYVPVLERETLESVEVINAKYRARKGIPDLDSAVQGEAEDVDE